MAERQPTTPVGEVEKKERFFKWVDPAHEECGTICTFVKYSLLIEAYGEKEAEEILIVNLATEISEREYELLNFVSFQL